jgi:hypothetical protein
MKMHPGLSAWAAAVGLLLMNQMTSAQSVWLPDTTSTMIGLEVWKIDYSEDFSVFRDLDISFGSATLFLTGELPVGRNNVLIAEIPYVFLNYTETWPSPYSDDIRVRDEFESGFGNPFIGFTFWDPERPLYLTAGVRLPLMPGDIEHAATLAQLTDFDRAEAFEEDAYSVRLRLGGKYADNSPLLVKFYVGGSYIGYSGSRSNLDRDIVLDYGIHARFRMEFMRVGVGFTGRSLLDRGSRSGFGIDRGHQLGFVALFGSGRFQPGLHVRLPLNERLRDRGLKLTYGLNLAFWPD